MQLRNKKQKINKIHVHVYVNIRDGGMKVGEGVYIQWTVMRLRLAAWDKGVVYQGATPNTRTTSGLDTRTCLTGTSTKTRRDIRWFTYTYTKSLLILFNPFLLSSRYTRILWAIFFTKKKKKKRAGLAIISLNNSQLCISTFNLSLLIYYALIESRNNVSSVFLNEFYF